jgi:hypothetical protein
LAALPVVHEGVAAVNIETGQAWLFIGENDVECADHDLAQGFISIRSCRAPDKETINEDAAAIIPFGPTALILAVADGVTISQISVRWPDGTEKLYDEHDSDKGTMTLRQ